MEVQEADREVIEKAGALLLRLDEIDSTKGLVGIMAESYSIIDEIRPGFIAAAKIWSDPERTAQILSGHYGVVNKLFATDMVCEALLRIANDLICIEYSVGKDNEQDLEGQIAHLQALLLGSSSEPCRESQKMAQKIMSIMQWLRAQRDGAMAERAFLDPDDLN